MIVLPAIDILDGKPVRLYQGDYGQSKCVAEDVLACAKKFEKEKANYLHVVDLNGAKLLDLTAWILMVVPSFILAQGWVYFSSGNGIASAWLGISGVGSFIFSYWGLVCVMVLCKFPMAYVTIKTSMEWYPARLMYAARMNGASAFEAWKSVQLPLCIPAYCSDCFLWFFCHNLFCSIVQKIIFFLSHRLILYDHGDHDHHHQIRRKYPCHIKSYR